MTERLPRSEMVHTEMAPRTELAAVSNVTTSFPREQDVVSLPVQYAELTTLSLLRLRLRRGSAPQSQNAGYRRYTVVPADPRVLLMSLAKH